METFYLPNYDIETAWITEQQLCPVCGAVMDAVDRFEEEETVFVWYECIRNDCKRRQLHKTIATETV